MAVSRSGLLFRFLRCEAQAAGVQLPNSCWSAAAVVQLAGHSSCLAARRQQLHLNSGQLKEEPWNLAPGSTANPKASSDRPSYDRKKEFTYVEYLCKEIPDRKAPDFCVTGFSGYESGQSSINN